jgi:homospermidine synthase
MNLNLSVCSIRSVLSGLISLPPPRLWPSYACQNVASWRDTRSDAQNNIKIKLCTYLSKPILKHRSHAKSSHNIYKKTCGTCALLVLFVTQAIGVQAYNYCTRRRLSLINRYTWIKCYKKCSVVILCIWNRCLAHKKMQKIVNILMP